MEHLLCPRTHTKQGSIRNSYIGSLLSGSLQGRRQTLNKGADKNNLTPVVTSARKIDILSTGRWLRRLRRMGGLKASQEKQLVLFSR